MSPVFVIAAASAKSSIRVRRISSGIASARIVSSVVFNRANRGECFYWLVISHRILHLLVGGSVMSIHVLKFVEPPEISFMKYWISIGFFYLEPLASLHHALTPLFNTVDTNS